MLTNGETINEARYYNDVKLIREDLDDIKSAIEKLAMLQQQRLDLENRKFQEWLTRTQEIEEMEEDIDEENMDYDSVWL